MTFFVPIADSDFSSGPTQADCTRRTLHVCGSCRRASPIIVPASPVFKGLTTLNPTSSSTYPFPGDTL